MKDDDRESRKRIARRPTGLHESMTEEQFENGYWYATDLEEFAVRIGVPSAGKLRKDEMERAIRHFIRHREVQPLVKRSLSKSGEKDSSKGLRMDLPVVNYTSNRETKDFIEGEAAKLAPGFKRRAGTRYLLNRWREEQLAAGRPITYGDIVRQAIELNQTKRGPLRLAHGRYVNFISDYMAQNRGAPQADAVRAWEEVKRLDMPKTYAAWAAARGRSRREA